MRRVPTTPPGHPALSYLDRVRWVEVTNVNAADAPGGALLKVTGGGTTDDDETDDYGVPEVNKPDADGLNGLLVAHPSGIAAGGRGLATSGDFVPVAYDDAETPAVGQTWGSASGSWELTKGKRGWRIGGEPIASQDLVLVEAWRRPDGGLGGDGDTPACDDLPLTFRVQVGTSVTKATVSGTSVVTDVIQRFRDVTITEDGCVELSEPYCETATTDTCVEGEDPGEDPPPPYASPSWWCIDGVCTKVYDGIAPATYDAGPFASKELCAGGCPAEGGTPSCCPGAEYATLFATLSGHGTKALSWNGVSWQSAPFTLTCDSGSFMLSFSQACELSWSDDGGETFTGITPAGTTVCGPPLSSTGWGFAPGGSCGTITVTVESP